METQNDGKILTPKTNSERRRGWSVALALTAALVTGSVGFQQGENRGTQKANDASAETIGTIQTMFDIYNMSSNKLDEGWCTDRMEFEEYCEYIIGYMNTYTIDDDGNEIYLYDNEDKFKDAVDKIVPSIKSSFARRLGISRETAENIIINSKGIWIPDTDGSLTQIAGFNYDNSQTDTARFARAFEAIETAIAGENVAEIRGAVRDRDWISYWLDGIMMLHNDGKAVEFIWAPIGCLPEITNQIKEFKGNKPNVRKLVEGAEKAGKSFECFGSGAHKTWEAQGFSGKPIPYNTFTDRLPSAEKTEQDLA